eukprot:4293755-Amphidinium_carterae.1
MNGSRPEMTVRAGSVGGGPLCRSLRLFLCLHCQNTAPTIGQETAKCWSNYNIALKDKGRCLRAVEKEEIG